MGFGTSIRQDIYEEVFGDTRDAKEWRDPFGFCLWSSLVMLLTLENWSRVRLQKPLNILFDNKPEFAGTAHKIFDMLKVMNEPEGSLTFGDLAFGDKRNHPSLQAADLITYETTRHWIEVERKGDVMDMHRVVKISNRRETLMTPEVSQLKQGLVDFRQFLNGFVGPMPETSYIRKQLKKRTKKKKRP